MSKWQRCDGRHDEMSWATDECLACLADESLDAAVAQYTDLDGDELREAAENLGGDVAKAADHLRRLREYHEHYSRGSD